MPRLRSAGRAFFQSFVTSLFEPQNCTFSVLPTSAAVLVWKNAGRKIRLPLGLAGQQALPGGAKGVKISAYSGKKVPMTLIH